ncbi:MAG TPA: His/Gly/Thr/Pro-type tRNA ligase C-terminal domain-containing protein, partial [Polyangiaceae bacterium]|nr:His/Gly/Thr/Pro-type tRNA ligase C-terminal domain-containing protein [Polyangiaceae bacterium]
MKSMLRRANGLGAPFAVLLGDAELDGGQVELKNLGAHTQERIGRGEVARVLGERLAGAPA